MSKQNVATRRTGTSGMKCPSPPGALLPKEFHGLHVEFCRRFSIEIGTRYDLLGCMRYVTERTDGRKLTKEHRAFIEGFMAAREE